MNPIFSEEGKGWPEFPKRSFGRLDHFEPADLANAQEAVFSFDAVDEQWLDNGFVQFFPGANPANVDTRMARIWAGLFRKGPRVADPFDQIRVYNIEVTVRRDDAFWNDIISMLDKQDWFEINLSFSGSFPVDVYGAITSLPVSANLQAITAAPPAVSQLLSAVFNVDHWPDATNEEVDAVLAVLQPFETLAMYDVGQGSAIGLLNHLNDVKLFFDVGAGSYGNKHTRPSPLRFCWRGNPSIVLSHWDTDHWAGASSDRAARGRRWLAPRQTGLGPRHHLFAGRILKNHGTLRIWNAKKGDVRTVSLGSNQDVSIVKCSGSDMNGSGIAMIVDDRSHKASWMLTGDAGYGEITLAPRFPVSGLAVPHHGADMSSKGGTPPAKASKDPRLLYSFGPDNSHGKTAISHPTSAAVGQHSGWSHGTWSTVTFATDIPGGEVLATACNSPTTSPAHSHSAAIGLAGKPSVPLSGLPCSTPGSKSGCTLNVVQA